MVTILNFLLIIYTLKVKGIHKELLKQYILFTQLLEGAQYLIRSINNDQDFMIRCICSNQQ